jgi:hypothetical protein
MKIDKRSLKSHKHQVLVESFMCGLVIVSLLTIPFYYISIGESMVSVMEKLELVIAMIFMAEFIARLLRSSNKKMYLKNYWWLLLAALPIPNVLGSVLKSFRLLGLIKPFRLLDHYEYEKSYSNRST